jgi:hypothetical protein
VRTHLETYDPGDKSIFFQNVRLSPEDLPRPRPNRQSAYYRGQAQIFGLFFWLLWIDWVILPILAAVDLMIIIQRKIFQLGKGDIYEDWYNRWFRIR